MCLSGGYGGGLLLFDDVDVVVAPVVVVGSFFLLANGSLGGLGRDISNSGGGSTTET